MAGSRSPLNRNDILHALGAEPIVPLTGGKAKYASYVGGVLRSLEDRAPKLRLELADFPRPEGQSFRLWMQNAVNALKAMAAGSAATLVVAGSAMATVSEPFGPDMGGTAVTISNCNITIDIEGCALRHTGPKAFEFTGCTGGGMVGNGTLTGPHNTSQYQIRVVDSPGLQFRGLNFATGNSGIEVYNSPACKFNDITFREMYAVGIKATRYSDGCEFVNVTGRNLAGFLLYGERWANKGVVVNPRKYLDESKLTTYLLTQVEHSAAGSDDRGDYPATTYIGEEGVGLTVDVQGWSVTGGEIANVGDNGISISAKFCRISNILLRDNRHDGLHFYGSFNVAVNVTGLNNGKYRQEIDPETGEVISSTPTNGYCVGVRPNAGACALGNRILGCISIGNRLGDFSDGDAQLYRWWEPLKADVPNTAPPGQPSNAVDNVKRYAMFNMGAWTTVWTAEGSTVPTAMGGVSPADYGIIIDQATGLPTNAASTTDNEGYVRWFDGLRWYYFRSSVKIGKGPWACETSWRGCYGDHPTRNYYQSSFVPDGANNSFESPAISVSDAYVFSKEEAIDSAPGGVLTLPASGIAKLNADGQQTVTRIVTPLGFAYHRILLRNGNSQPWTFTFDAAKIRLFGGANVTLGYNDTIELLQIAVSGSQIWLQVGGSVRSAPTSLGAGWTAGSGACVLTDAGNGTIQHTAVGATATPDFNQRVARGTPEAPANVSTGTIVQKWVGGAYWNGSYRLIGRVYSVVSAYDELGEPRLSYRWNFQPYAHAAGGGEADNNDYIGFVLDHDGNMGLGTPNTIITYPKAHLEVTEDIAADMFALRSETAIVDAGVVGNSVTIGEVGLVKITTVAPASISQVSSVSQLRPEVLIYNGGSQALTFVHDLTKLRLHGGQNFVLKANDYIRLQRLTTAAPHLWLQVGGYSTP
ncbi:hypothetical protein ABI_15470 [Asticcacaulis biprosthecium C19]|uniref:Right handed beta helix domain-containing protein n=1 Tax=Asticcacaulis biprosthecium C19 TaxID=715226 RepID=F4QJC4_9CAUL|nr:hypothetical protein [Asticcacaulis biprosthecium]EGF93107.1 hypothetical protein ABI_15470 [Asticcacaulis biprosthecium C19]